MSEVMKRLTFSDEELIGAMCDCSVKMDTQDVENGVTERFCERVCDEFGDICPFKQLGNRLKKYEDTNHTPEQIKEFDKVYLDKCQEVNKYTKINQECIDTVGVGIGMMPLKFKEFFDDFKTFDHYRELNEQGRLVELPCKVGDTLYVLHRTFKDVIVEGKAICFTWWLTDGFWVKFHSDQYNYGNVDIAFSNFGKTVFLTKAEAEKVMAESEVSE